jgi:hypothetical protein
VSITAFIARSSQVRIYSSAADCPASSVSRAWTKPDRQSEIPIKT